MTSIDEIKDLLKKNKRRFLKELAESKELVSTFTYKIYSYNFTHFI